MASETFRYTSAASAVKQVDLVTIAGTVEVGDVFTIAVTGIDGVTQASVSFIATAATAANVATGLVTAWNASSNTLISAITAADTTGSLTLTADVAGIGFTITVASTETGGGALDAQTIVRSAVTPNSGPYNFANPHNWSWGGTQVDVITIAGTVEATDIFNIVVTGANGLPLTITYTAVDTSATTVAAGLKTAWNASTDIRCTGVTADNTDGVLTLTADVTGVPFYISAVSTTEAAGVLADAQTIVHTSTLGLPGSAATQIAIVEDAKILYGLDRSASTDLASLTVRRSQIGYNADSTGVSAGYLAINPLLLYEDEPIGVGTSTPKAPVHINVGDTATVATIYDTTTNSKTTSPAVRLLGTGITIINVLKGKVGVAYDDWEVSTVGIINILDSTAGNTNTDVYIGKGVTLTTLNKYGGDCWLNCAATTITQMAGTLTTDDTGAVTTINNYGGTLESNSSGTITTLNGYGGVLDFLQSQAARTVTTLKVDPGCTLKYNPTSLTLTNKVQPVTTAKNIQYICSAV